VADPGSLSPAFESYAGIAAAQLRNRPDPASVLHAFHRDCSPPLVVHGADTFVAFLAAAGLTPPPCIDVLDLARIAVPEADNYSLSELAADLGLQPEPAVRAPDRARLLSAVWPLLLARLEELPPPALDALCRLLTLAASPLAPVVARSAEGTAFRLASDPDGAVRDLLPNHRKAVREALAATRGEPTSEPIPVDAICRMYGPGAAIGTRLEGYEHRLEQVDMVRAVCEALNEPQHLVVEAGTGIGKSLAYLLPAIAWACTNGDPVVVSTNTKNLQQQLYRKDLPFLTGLLPGRFRAALLKGRRNYLCARRFLYLLRNFERELAEPDELMALAALVSWAARTQTGDLAECNGFFTSPGAPQVLPAVVSDSDECAGPACRVRGRCFLRRARALAAAADLIIVNHALLFAEMQTQVLPPYRCAVLDEAHNLESVATDAFAVSASALSFYRVTNLLFRKRPDGAGTGLLAVLMHEANDECVPAALRDAVTRAAGATMEAVDDVVASTRQMFEVLAEPFHGRPAHQDRILLAECQPDIGDGSEAWHAAGRLRTAVAELGSRLDPVLDALDRAGDELPNLVELAHDLRAALERLRQAADAVTFVLQGQDETFVYWLQRTTRERGTFCSLHAAPVTVGRYVREHFLAQKRTVVLASATLQVDGDFGYTLERLGCDQLPPDRVRCLSVGSPFDYDRQAFVGVTTFLPDPGGRRSKDYDDGLAAFLRDLLVTTRGRALVLFTSYSLLQHAYETLREPLEREGIMVLAQGRTGSREAITALFRAVSASVLLGTRSFWEGVDVAGETLSCLVVTKLPFHVVTDPLVRGRTHYLQTLGHDPFTQYTLPEAVISFRQGFGRLIRRKTDTGVVIVTDRRMVTKPYGQTFVRSLPTGHAVLRSPAEAIHAVDTFLHPPRHT
jgi:ATP-dependent DNA helicase DinG